MNMARNSEMSHNPLDLVALPPSSELTLLPPNSGAVGRFLADTEIMFRAIAMRMSGLLRRINESGRRTETLLRTGSERMEATESALQQQLQKQGLLSENEDDNKVEDPAE
jgi:hypothetical protein